MLVIPKTKHIASSMFDLPLPFSPVIELKLSSLIHRHDTARHRDRGDGQTYHPEMTVRTAYDLNPWAFSQPDS